MYGLIEALVYSVALHPDERRVEEQLWRLQTLGTGVEYVAVGEDERLADDGAAVGEAVLRDLAHALLYSAHGVDARGGVKVVAAAPEQQPQVTRHASPPHVDARHGRCDGEPDARGATRSVSAEDGLVRDEGHPGKESGGGSTRLMPLRSPGSDVRFQKVQKRYIPSLPLSPLSPPFPPRPHVTPPPAPHPCAAAGERAQTRC